MCKRTEFSTFYISRPVDGKTEIIKDLKKAQKCLDIHCFNVPLDFIEALKIELEDLQTFISISLQYICKAHVKIWCKNHRAECMLSSESNYL